MKTFIYFSLFLPKPICRPGEPHSCSEGRCRSQRPKCLCYLHHLGTRASIWQTHRDHSAPQWWAIENCFSFLVVSGFFLMKFECDFNEQTSSTEPHSPLVILERGRLSFSQYEQQISSRRDFIRCTRKDSEPERKVGSYSPCFSASPYSPLISHTCPKLTCLCSTWPAAGVCEEAIPQGHSEQPRPDAQLLSRLAVWASGAAQSHQRTAVPCRSQRQHERHQHPPCKGELQAG